MTTFEELYNRTHKHVKNFRTDFDVDKKTIEKNPGKKFIHIARTNGTSLNMFFNSEDYPNEGEKVKYLFNALAGREKLLQANIETMEYYLNNDPKQINYFNGHKLIRIDSNKALELMESHSRQLRAHWEEERIRARKDKQLIY